MATPSQIIDTRDIKGLPVSDAVHAVRDTASGLTDELKNTQLMQILGASAPAYLDDSDWDYEPGVPTLDVVLSKLGVKVNDDPTGIKSARKFVEDFPKKRDAWKKKIERDPNYGKQGWETVYNLFKQTSNDLMNADIDQARRDIATGKDADGLDWLQTKVANIMFPRATQAVAEGRDPETNEWVRDAVSNAAYAIPMGRIAGTLTRNATPIVRSAGSLASQALVPTAVSAMDNIVDDSRDATDFLTDAAIGTAANLGVNRILGPWIAGKIGSLSGKVSRGRLPSYLRNVLEGGATPQDKAIALVNASKQVLKDEERGLAKGLEETVAPPTREAISEAGKIIGINDAVNAPMRTPSGAIVMDKATGKPITTRDIIGLVEKQKGDELLAREAEDVIGSAIQQVLNPSTATVPINKAFREGARGYAEILRAHPELKSLYRGTTPFLSKKVTEDLGNMAMSYGVNQFGNNTPEAAKVVLSQYGIDPEQVKRDSEKEKKKSASASAIRKVLETTPELTEEDEFYLSKVRDNPDLLTFSDDAGLKQWLLKKGHSLLKGTPAHRPLWEVK